jgi:hypothetical protein
MSTYPCPQGHDSIEADYCSECGAKIQGATIPKGAPIGTTPASQPGFTPPSAELSRQHIPCPDCSTPHDLTEGNFCEICGYNFATGASGELPVKSPAIPTVNPTAAPEKPPAFPAKSAGTIALPTSATGWAVIVSVEPALRDALSPPAPDRAAIALPLEKSVNLLGRTSAARAVYPEIPLDFDAAVSQRHALLVVQPDGSLICRDIGSSNGTRLNGTELTVMADVPVQDRDELTLGHWTKVQICRS